MDNSNNNSEQENPIINSKWDKKLIVAYCTVGLVALAVVGFIIYNKVIPSKLKPNTQTKQNQAILGNPNNLTNLNQQYQYPGVFANNNITPDSGTTTIPQIDPQELPYHPDSCANPLPPIVSKSGKIKWEQPEFLKGNSIFEANGDFTYFGENDYLVGHFISGKYEGGDLILVVLPYPSFAGSEFFDHIVKFNGKYYLLAKYSESLADEDSPPLTTEGVIIDKDYELSDLDFPEKINLANPAVTLSHLSGNGFYYLDHLAFCASGLIKLESNPAVGDVYTESTSTAPIGFYVKIPDGSQRLYTLDISIMGQNNTPAITWDDGTKNSQPYTYTDGDLDGCGAPTVMDVQDVPMTDLVQTGVAANGDPIYEYKDNSNQALSDVYKASLDPTISAPSQPSIYHDFLLSHPIFFWKNQFGHFVRFINKKYRPWEYCG